MTNTLKNTVFAALAASLALAAPMAANAGDIGEKALKGAVAGAVLTEITGGDAKDGLALGAAAGALGGKIAEDRDRHDRKDDRKKGGNKHKR
ncbi:hypothetical protein [Ruegeria arenilitoris]|uniref:hypothetical protein n=1 Tax=Ruegeria arenilitoris TaxID=1173585 RepID=UPI00147ED4D9|nr:hypothetical protein [Ruegeria arenilitoris]